MTLRELIAESSDLTGPDLDAACETLRAVVLEELRTAGVLPMYLHVTPFEDDPKDHDEGGCVCNPFVDEAGRTVFHRPLPAMAQAADPARPTLSARGLRYK